VFNGRYWEREISLRVKASSLQAATKRAMYRLFREGKKKGERIEQVQVQMPRLGPMLPDPTTTPAPTA
jgi:hypothetical protein